MRIFWIELYWTRCPLASRYKNIRYLSRLYEYLFEPLDGPTFSQLESEIRDSVEEFIPGITITKLIISPASEDDEDKGTYVNGNDERVFRVPGIGTKEHTAKINKLSVEEVKARVRAKGMTIEGE